MKTSARLEQRFGVEAHAPGTPGTAPIPAQSSGANDYRPFQRTGVFEISRREGGRRSSVTMRMTMSGGSTGDERGT